MLLILDLDETLIHASQTKLSHRPEDFTFDKYFVYKRPHLDHFLQEVARHFKLGVWSSAGDEYVSGMINDFGGISNPTLCTWPEVQRSNSFLHNF